MGKGAANKTQGDRCGQTCDMHTSLEIRTGCLLSCFAIVRSSPDQLPPHQPMLVRPLSAQELAAKTMAACTDPLVKKQLGYLLGRQGVVRPCQHNHNDSLCWHVRHSPWQLPLSAGHLFM